MNRDIATISCRCISISLIVLGSMLISSPSRAEEVPDVVDEQLQQLVSWLSGSFSSSAQAGADEDYLDLRLHMQPIWSERSDGFWLYVEQALADQQDQPYRQRVYQATRISDNLFEVRVFTLPDPGLYIGAWNQEAPFAELAPEQLIEREGCSILIRQQPDGSYIGSTIARLCASKLGEAAYATSEVTVSRSRIESWDRGWDSNGTQIWGAAKQPYLFDRLLEPEETGATQADEKDEADIDEAVPAPTPAPEQPQQTPAGGGESKQESTSS